MIWRGSRPSWHCFPLTAGIGIGLVLNVWNTNIFKHLNIGHTLLSMFWVASVNFSLSQSGSSGWNIILFWSSSSKGSILNETPSCWGLHGGEGGGLKYLYLLFFSYGSPIIKKVFFSFGHCRNSNWTPTPERFFFGPYSTILKDCEFLLYEKCPKPS